VRAYQFNADNRKFGARKRNLGLKLQLVWLVAQYAPMFKWSLRDSWQLYKLGLARLLNCSQRGFALCSIVTILVQPSCVNCSTLTVDAHVHRSMGVETTQLFIVIDFVKAKGTDGRSSVGSRLRKTRNDTYQHEMKRVMGLFTDVTDADSRGGAVR
jgi:hypothetical protein